MTAIATPRNPIPGLFAALRHTGGRVLETLALLANASSLMREVERLNASSDEALAARGTTRSAEVDRIFGARHY